MAPIKETYPLFLLKKDLPWIYNLKLLIEIMPKKVKKKSAKKKAKKEKKDDDDDEKPTFEVPEYRDPDIYTPRAKLKILLANHVSTKLGKFFIHSKSK